MTASSWMVRLISPVCSNIQRSEEQPLMEQEDAPQEEQNKHQATEEITSDLTKPMAGGKE
jgi:hypothetical protein